jgi:hypothetical protein
LQFPIVGDVDRKGNSGQGTKMFSDQAKSIAALRQDAQDAIEQFQPYNLGADFANHPLWKLQQLSNVDKHRALHFAGAYGGGFALDRTKSRNAEVTSVTVIGERVKEGTIVGRLSITKPDPDQSMYVDLEPRPAIQFLDGPVQNADVFATLGEIQKFLLIEVFEKLGPML